MNVLLLQLDGKLPNIALMRIAAHCRPYADDLAFQHCPTVKAVEASDWWGFDRIYASLIFERTRPVAEALLQKYRFAEVGGTGWDVAKRLEDIGITTKQQDYGMYPHYPHSIGFTQRGCRLKCKFCLTPGSLLISDEGLTPIEDVRVGQKVLTHQGRYRQVLTTMSRQYTGDVLTLHSGAMSNLFQTTVTAEHPLFTRHVSYRSGGQRLTSWSWVKAERLKAGRPRRSRDVYAFPRTVEEMMPTKDDLPDGVELNEHLMTLVGWYLAEGYVSSSKKRGVHRVTFCLGHSDDEMGFAKEIQNAAAALDIQASIRRLKTGIRVCIDRVKWARWFEKHFGHLAHKKRVPLWIRLLPSRFLVPIAAAWICGDGCVHLKKGTPTYKGTSVSPQLVCGMREVFLKLGHCSTINKHKASSVIQGRAVNAKPAYTVISHPKMPVKRSITADEAYVYWPIKEPVRQHYDGMVYNLEVDEDNSFCTPAFCLHNCVVPRKEGAVVEEQTITDIWRKEPYPRNIVLLDNDFFGQPNWRQRIEEIREGDFKVSFNQGINCRMITDEAAAAIASVRYYDDDFKRRRIYTAWDNLKDEERLFAGLEALTRHGVKPDQIMVYMLIGYWPGETAQDRDYRRRRLREFGCRPYPMPFVRTKELVGFQRWVIGAYDKRFTWDHWQAADYRPEKLHLVEAGVGAGNMESVASP